MSQPKPHATAIDTELTMPRSWPITDAEASTSQVQFQYPGVLYQATHYPVPVQYQEYQAYDGTHYTY